MLTARDTAGPAAGGRWCRIALCWLLLVPGPPPGAETAKATAPESMTLSFRDTSIQEVYEMLSRQGRVNILLGQGVTGSVSVNLFEVGLDEAIRVIADAAGFTVERRQGSYFVLTREEAGKDSTAGNTEIRTFKVQYSNPDVVAELLSKHLSRYGKITTLADRQSLVVEDLPEFLDRVILLLGEVDREPKQILIEARILEIALTADQTFGIDWRFISSNFSIGQLGLAPRALPGLFVDVITDDLELFLRALSRRGRVRTLSTPKLLVLENQEAEVVVGDRLGYRLTTTINQVTTESVEFLESGVILRVRPSIDRDGRILLEVHPEVSTGSITNGLPNQATTEVTTQMLARDGQRIFIGGLIKRQDTEAREGVPGLSDVPIIGGLFSRTDRIHQNTETVVVITPHVVDPRLHAASEAVATHIDGHEAALIQNAERDSQRLPSVLDAPLEDLFAPDAEPTAKSPPPLRFRTQDWGDG